MQVSDQDGSNDLQLFYSIPDYGGRDGDVVINDKHLHFYKLVMQGSISFISTMMLTEAENGEIFTRM